jgi:hypothetical protein
MSFSLFLLPACHYYGNRHQLADENCQRRAIRLRHRSPKRQNAANSVLSLNRTRGMVIVFELYDVSRPVGRYNRDDKIRCREKP